MDIRLPDKVAIVTGSASGIGAEMVRLFLEAGARVVAVDLASQSAPAPLVEQHGDRLRAVVGDVAREETATAYVRTAVEAFGRVDVMINNAGIACVKPIAEH